jgi:hypothetical protein
MQAHEGEFRDFGTNGAGLSEVGWQGVTRRGIDDTLWHPVAWGREVTRGDIREGQAQEARRRNGGGTGTRGSAGSGERRPDGVQGVGHVRDTRTNLPKAGGAEIPLLRA